MLLDSYYVGNAFSTHKYISKEAKILHYPSQPSLLMRSKCCFISTVLQPGLVQVEGLLNLEKAAFLKKRVSMMQSEFGINFQML